MTSSFVVARLRHTIARFQLEMASTSSQSLPPYFPLVRKECEERANAFFQCLVEQSEPVGNRQSGDAALEACKDKHALYRKCTETSLNAKGAKKPIVLVDWETD